MEKRNRYRKHCHEELSIPIFSRDWWLDAVCGPDNWGVALLEQGNEIIGSLPYYVLKRYRFTNLVLPPLTQSLGPWIRPSTAKYAKRLGYQKKVMLALIEKLPEFDQFTQNFHFTIGNWLPFFWRGFQQTTRYTYRLPELENEEELWKGLTESTRREIRKATKRFKLNVRNDLAFDVFWELNRKTFERQGKAVPYTRELVERLDSACIQRGCRSIWVAEDAQKNHHAAVYIVWDENCAYYLMGGADTSLRNSGAFTLAMWEAIRHAAAVTKQFDFEGSMLEPVEHFFRGFGSLQTPYFHITKTTSRPLKIYKFLKDHRPLRKQKRY